MLKGGYLNDTKNPDCSGFFASSRERVMKPLTLVVSRSILRLPYQDKHSLTHNPPYLATASPKHCELSPWFVADLQIKTNPIFVLQREELPTYPLSASTDITGNGDGWKNKYRPLAVLGPMSGKWGSYTFNLTTGRE